MLCRQHAKQGCNDRGLVSSRVQPSPMTAGHWLQQSLADRLTDDLSACAHEQPSPGLTQGKHPAGWPGMAASQARHADQALQLRGWPPDSSRRLQRVRMKSKRTMSALWGLAVCFCRSWSTPSTTSCAACSTSVLSCLEADGHQQLGRLAHEASNTSTGWWGHPDICHQCPVGSSLPATEKPVADHTTWNTAVHGCTCCLLPPLQQPVAWPATRLPDACQASTQTAAAPGAARTPVQDSTSTAARPPAEHGLGSACPAVCTPEAACLGFDVSRVLRVSRVLGEHVSPGRHLDGVAKGFHSLVQAVLGGVQQALQ